MRAAVSNHLQKTATAMEIFLILLKMCRQFIDLARKKRDLH